MANPQNYITEDTTIKGSITTASSLTVAGAIEGDVNAGGEVVVLDDAFIKGDVSGPNVRVQGKVEGRISASGKLVITSAGEVHGDVSVRALLIEEGGTLQGQCNMGSGAGQQLPPKFGTRPSAGHTAVASQAERTNNGPVQVQNLPAPPLNAPDPRPRTTTTTAE